MARLLFPEALRMSLNIKNENVSIFPYLVFFSLSRLISTQTRKNTQKLKGSSNLGTILGYPVRRFKIKISIIEDWSQHPHNAA